MAHPIRSARQMTLTQRVESSIDTWHGGRRAPVVRLRGEWLEENGFTTGSHLVVTVERGRIVVTLASEVER